MTGSEDRIYKLAMVPAYHTHDMTISRLSVEITCGSS